MFFSTAGCCVSHSVITICILGEYLTPYVQTKICSHDISSCFTFLIMHVFLMVIQFQCHCTAVLVTS